MLKHPLFFLWTVLYAGVATTGVHVHHLRKQYPPTGQQRVEGTVAVHDLCLRVKQQECFSLLVSECTVSVQ